MSPHATVHWAGEALHLLPAHAVWWAAGETLFIGALQLGKTASYRALASPCPAAPRATTWRGWTH